MCVPQLKSNIFIHSILMCPRYFVLTHFISISPPFFVFQYDFFLHSQPLWATLLLLPVLDKANPTESAVYRGISIKLNTNYLS